MNEHDKRVKSYYQSLTLPQSRLDQLIDVSTRKKQNSSLWSRFRLKTKACVQQVQHPLLRAGLAAAMIATVALFIHTSGSVQERADSTFREVAMNHGTRLDLEYYGDDLASLDDSMQQLPFTLVLPDVVKTDVKLIGARYCSLVGNLSAHVKFQDQESGKPVSLFVTRSTSELKRIQGRSNRIDGVDVELWQEGGLFFALAQQG